MQSSQRNFSAVGCVVGHSVYDAYLFRDDVLHCHTPPVEEGIVVSVVLLRDHTLRRAESGSVKLPTGVIATLHEGDLIPLPSHITLTSTRHPRESLRLVTHSRRALPTPNQHPYRWRFCLMTQISPFANLLPNWVAYHRRVGIDHVYIFDNGAKENITAMFENRPDVEVLSWPFHKCQEALVGWFLWVARSRCEVVLHMDVDEYLMMGLGSKTEYAQDTPLSAMAERAAQKGRKSFKFPYIWFRNQGYRLNPGGFIPEIYMQFAKQQGFRNGKAFCSTDESYESGLAHSCGKVNGRQAYFYVTTAGKFGESCMYPTKRGDDAFTMHFRERSWEEWVEKCDAGWVIGDLVADRNKGTLDVNDPPKYYMTVDGEMYTHFRDLSRRVMKEGKHWERVAVLRSTDGLACRLVLVESGEGVSGRCA